MNQTDWIRVRNKNVSFVRLDLIFFLVVSSFALDFDVCRLCERLFQFLTHLGKSFRIW